LASRKGRGGGKEKKRVNLMFNFTKRGEKGRRSFGLLGSVPKKKNQRTTLLREGEVRKRMFLQGRGERGRYLPMNSGREKHASPF